MRTCVRLVIVCVLLPRFELAVAAGGREALLGEPAALAPEASKEQFIGEVSLAAEAFGVRRGMRLGEALARCPRLVLLPPDPVGVADGWEAALERLEGIGAAVEPIRPGLGCFDAQGLLRLHGRLEGVLEAARQGLRARAGEDSVPALVARLGVGPTRFLAVAAASRARPRRPEIVAGAEELAREPVALLELREETAALAAPLERLGIATLGELAALPRAALADRFGRAGLLAHDLVRGRDTPLRPRLPGERLEETLELPESGSGEQLERALGMLIDRLVARRERKGRTLRSVVVSARLVEGGTWRERVVFREALADAGRMRLALGGHLAKLPAPAEALRLAVERFGPPHAGSQALFDDNLAQRRARLREAVRQARAAAGPDAALRVLEVDPGSRVPERRAVLAPFEVGDA
jgi:protein ImuB